MSGTRQGTSIWIHISVLLILSTTLCNGQAGECRSEDQHRGKSVYCERIINLNAMTTMLNSENDTIVQLVITGTGGLIFRKQYFQHPAFISLNYLELSNNNIQKFDPEILTSMKNLHYLDLSENRITNVDLGSSASLSMLLSLSLDCNRIRNIGDGAFRRLVNLTTLDLRSNYLETFTYAMIGDLTRLKSIDLSANLLTNVDDQVFKGLSNLQTIHLEKNKLTSIDPNSFKNNVFLRYVNLGGNKLWSIDEELFLNNPNIETLDLSSIGLSKNINNFPLRHLNKLGKLVLTNNNITAIPVDYFSHVPNLQYLDLSQNQIGSIEIGTLSSILKLRILKLTGNRMRSVNVATFSSEFYRVFKEALTYVASESDEDYDSDVEFSAHRKYYSIDLSNNNWDSKTSDMVELRGWLQQRGHDFDKVFKC